MKNKNSETNDTHDHRYNISKENMCKPTNKIYWNVSKPWPSFIYPRKETIFSKSRNIINISIYIKVKKSTWLISSRTKITTLKIIQHLFKNKMQTNKSPQKTGKERIVIFMTIIWFVLSFKTLLHLFKLHKLHLFKCNWCFWDQILYFSKYFPCSPIPFMNNFHNFHNFLH